MILGSRIFLVSTTIFHSSLVAPSSMKTSIWGMTLKAMLLGELLGLERPVDEEALGLVKSSSIASLPAPDVD